MSDKLSRTLAEHLDLPDGLTATRFPSMIEITGPGLNKPCWIPVPYDVMSRERWQAFAAAALVEAGHARVSPQENNG